MHPSSLLLLLFVLVPLVELRLLFLIADAIGGWETFFLVVATGVAGGALARRQGLKVLAAIRNDLAGGRLPTDHLLSGLIVLVGAALLVTPGVVTDAVGLACMIPGNRRLLVGPIKRRLARHVTIHAAPPFAGPGFEKEAEDVTVRDDAGRAP